MFLVIRWCSISNLNIHNLLLECSIEISGFEEIFFFFFKWKGKKRDEECSNEEQLSTMI